MIAVTGALAQQWKELDPATRAVYQKMSDDEKARLAAENPEVEAAPKAPRKRASKKGGPTKPPSAQVLFLSETKAAKKAANPGLSAPELAALQREEWKSMGEEAQQTWKEKVLVLAKRYKIEKAEWDEKHPAADEDGDDEADGAAGADDDAPMAASSSAASSSDKGKKERKKKKKEKKEKKEKKNKKDKVRITRQQRRRDMLCAAVALLCRPVAPPISHSFVRPACLLRVCFPVWSEEKEEGRCWLGCVGRRYGG